MTLPLQPAQAGLPILERVELALQDLTSWLVCWPIASAEDMAQSFPGMAEGADAALSDLRALMQQMSATTSQAAPAPVVPAPVEGVHANPHPEKCPITGRRYFMTLEHPELGLVPTYGGPFDSYTIPHAEGEPSQPWHERELVCHHYDHDAGSWDMESVESVPLRIIHEDVLNELLDAKEAALALPTTEKVSAPAPSAELDAAGEPKLELTVLERVALDTMNGIKAWLDGGSGPFPDAARVGVEAYLMTAAQRRKGVQ